MNVKSKRSLMLIAFLVVAPLPVTAQDGTASRQAPKTPEDLSDPLGLLLAAGAGAGFDSDSPRRPTAYAGVKIGGGAFMLDLGYDRVQSRGGFSTELSAMLPLVRFPKAQTDPSKNYVRVYGEPGVGYRTGSGRSGGYGSAKLMVALLSDTRLTSNDAPPSPFVEIQRRFPLTSALPADTRVVIGLMLAICNHCGLQ